MTYSVTKYVSNLSLLMLFISLRINLSFLAHKSIFNSSLEDKWVLAFKLDYTQL